MKRTLQLVGAGPGDPELITIKALNAIKQAEVILYDALVTESLLDFAQPATIKKFVGKRFGCHALSQEEINHLIVEFSLHYKRIVRLKGGDPFVFGRAVEEMEIAISNGIKVEIIPDISSSIAVPATQMIPLTARGITESFWVTTGTTRSGQISDDIRLAAMSTATVVILMAMSKLEEIMDVFCECGKSETPVAIIQNGTTTQAKLITGTVIDIAYRATYERLKNPAIIVVGEVVKLRSSLLSQMISENNFLNHTISTQDKTI